MSISSAKSSEIKKLKVSYQVKERLWVGDGFYVHGLLRPSEELNPYISPFILMDYASPKKFRRRVSDEESESTLIGVLKP